MTSLNQLKYLILDMDGVLWLGKTPMPRLSEFFETLNRFGIAVALATNNATSTVDMYLEKLAGFGVTVPAQRIITSAVATGRFLSTKYPAGTSAYVVGGPGIMEAMKSAGFRILNDDPTAATADLVVVGLDREINYEKLSRASLYIARGAAFYGTNPDPSYPSERGELPGAGAIIASIVATTDKKPVIIGKPGGIMFQEALRSLDATPEETAMVGDRLATDILGAQQVGLKTILTLSGVTDKISLGISDIRPDWVFPDIAAIMTALIEERAKVNI
jgi:4-nitrophenyl phosphatase